MKFTVEYEQEEDGRKQRQEKVVRQLSRETEHVVVNRLAPRATRKFATFALVI